MKLAIKTRKQKKGINTYACKIKTNDSTNESTKHKDAVLHMGYPSLVLLLVVLCNSTPVEEGGQHTKQSIQPQLPQTIQITIHLLGQDLTIFWQPPLWLQGQPPHVKWFFKLWNIHDDQLPCQRTSLLDPLADDVWALLRWKLSPLLESLFLFECYPQLHQFSPMFS